MARHLKLRGAVVLVTGAGSGIGRALVSEILRRGAYAIAVENDLALKGALIEEIGARGAVHIADVRDTRAMNDLVQKTIHDFGGVDVVIANAAIERLAPTIDMPDTDFEAVLETNIQGVYRTIKPALGNVVARGGHVLAISSISGLIPFPMASAYSASKAAVDIMLRTLRMELIGTRATAGVAYFGNVQTHMLDCIQSDKILSKMLAPLPNRLLGVMPVRRPVQVAGQILDGVERRKARIFAPWMVRVTFLLRGLYPYFDGIMGRYVMRIDQRIKEHRAGQ